MTYCNTATPYRAKERQRPAPKWPDEPWYIAMFYEVLTLLYVEGILPPERFRKIMPLAQRQHSYLLGDLYVKGCTQLRADLYKRRGKILGDIDWLDTETRESPGMWALKPKTVTAGLLMAVLPSCIYALRRSGPIRASPWQDEAIAVP